MGRVRGASVRVAREAAGFSQAEVARRLAAEAGETRDAAALRQLLRRIEERDAPMERTDAEIEALARILGVPVDHLRDDLLWSWWTPGERRGPVLLASTAVAWSDPNEAQRWRDLAVLSGAFPSEVVIGPTTKLRLTEALAAATGLDRMGQGLAAESILVDLDKEDFNALVRVALVATGLLDPVSLPEDEAVTITWRLNLARIQFRAANRLALALAGGDTELVDELRDQIAYVSRLVIRAEEVRVDRITKALADAASD